MKVRAVNGDRTYVIDDRRDLVRAGGEGGVYRLRGAPTLVAKLYHEPAGRRAKLEAMLRNPPVDDATPGHKSIAWPVDILEAANGSRGFLGFVMPMVDRASAFHEFSNPSRRAKQHPRFTFRDLHVVASNAASAFWALHQKGYVVGDVNEGNLLIRDDGLATVVDTDSFQVADPSGKVFRCKVGREEFTPPELQRVVLAEVDREVRHDLFGLSVLLFQLLMEGFHPFSGVPVFKGEAWTLGRRIAEGNFPWDGSSKPYKVPPLAPPLEVLDPRLQRLFIDAFTTPRKRPNARLWKREIDAAINRLQSCGRVQSHAFGKHLSDCPWCARDALLGNGRKPPRGASEPVVSVSAISVPRSFNSQSRPSRSLPRLSMPTISPPRPVSEITPGTWRLHPNPQVQQMFGGLIGSDQIYELRPNGSCNVRGVMNIMEMRSEFTADCSWSYDYVNKLLAIDGLLRVKHMDLGNPWMNMFGGAIPPQPFNARLTVVDGVPGRVTVRDESSGINFPFVRL